MALNRSGLNQATPAGDPLDGMTQRELLDLRAQIDTMIDLTSIGDLDMDKELALQLKTVKLLQQEAHRGGGDVTFAHKASTTSVVQRLLQELTRMRTDLFNAERSKQVESFIIKAWQGVEPPPEGAAAFKECKDLFFEQYERMLATLDEMEPGPIEESVEL
jgi:hypothetical protein